MSEFWKILRGDVRARLMEMEANTVNCCVTSPPYWGLRDYGHDAQIGLEPDFDEWLATMVEVFDLVRKVLKPDGTCWVNLGDAYASGGADSSGPVGDKGTLDGTHHGPDQTRSAVR